MRQLKTFQTLKDIKNVKGKEKFEEKTERSPGKQKEKTSIIREKQIKSFL